MINNTEQILLNAGFGEMRHARGNHWDGCEYVHYECAIKALIDELQAAQKERDEYRQKLEQAEK